MKKQISWKILLPVGLLLHFVGGVVGLLGDLMFIFGVIDLIRSMRKKKEVKSE